MKQPVERRLAAILAADVAGYSRLMGLDEAGTAQALREHRAAADPLIAQHGGRIVKTTGDGVLIEFGSVVGAVQCAIALQKLTTERNAGSPGDRRMEWRIGIHLGDVLVEGDDILGDGVNIAARLEGIAEPGGICISEDAFRQVRGKVEAEFADIGEQSLKNIARPVRAYARSAEAVASTALVAPPAQPDPVRHSISPGRTAIALSTAAVIAIGIAAWWAWPKGNAPTVQVQVPAAASPQISAAITSTPAPRLSFVVLPFANLSNDPDQEYFADVITDDLTTDLSRISDSFVIARTTAFTYKGKAIDVKQIGHELGVRFVIEGSVRRAGKNVGVNVQLIDAESGAHVWADRFDANQTDLAEGPSEITGRLARSLNAELVVAADRRIERERAADPDARALVMRGWARIYSGSPTAATTEEALQFFERALVLDQGSVEAKIGTAAALVGRLNLRWSSSVERDQARAEQLLEEALDRDPNNSKAHVSKGVLRSVQNRLAEAQIELETAIALDRNNLVAFRMLGGTLMQLGQPEAAIPYIEKSIRLSPHDPRIVFNYSSLGQCHLLLGHLDQAIELLRKARAADPRFFGIHLNLAGALGLRGDLDEARAEVAEAIKLKPEVNSLAALRAYFPQITNPPYWALREKTVNAGLRRAGFPEE
jgi:adenylate cyclase